MRWGCDAPAAEPVFFTTCPRCLGTAAEPDPYEPMGSRAGEPCTRCEGEGHVPRFRCPAAECDGWARLGEVLHDLDLGVGYPNPGPRGRQPARLIQALRLWRLEVAAIRDAIEAEAEAKARARGQRR